MNVLVRTDHSVEKFIGCLLRSFRMTAIKRCCLNAFDVDVLSNVPVNSCLILIEKTFFNNHFNHFCSLHRCQQILSFVDEHTPQQL